MHQSQITPKKQVILQKLYTLRGEKNFCHFIDEESEIQVSYFPLIKLYSSLLCTNGFCYENETQEQIMLQDKGSCYKH